MNRSKPKLNAEMRRAGLFFVLPGLIAFAFFSFYPLISNAIQSFYYIRGAGNPWRFIAFENYIEVLSSSDFWYSLWVTFLYVLLTVPIGTLLSLIVAIAITGLKSSKGFIRALYFLPSVAGTVVISIIFSWIYEPYNGLLNLLFERIGLGPFLWLRGKNSALISIAMMTIWRTLGYNVVILMAGVLAIPRSLYESAELDGFTNFKKHIYITIPLCMPTITFVFIYNSIQNLQMFTESFVMTGGGPGFATRTIGFGIYQEAFLYSKFGKASACAVCLMVIIVGITMLQLKYFNKQEEAME
ncbi:MAG: carbohydrate ABC transporter permease [Sphaerochaetaceae bacterium]